MLLVSMKFIGVKPHTLGSESNVRNHRTANEEIEESFFFTTQTISSD